MTAEEYRPVQLVAGAPVYHLQIGPLPASAPAACGAVPSQVGWCFPPEGAGLFITHCCTDCLKQLITMIWRKDKEEPDMSAEVREALAAYAHDAWAGWMGYLWSKSSVNADGSVTIPASAADRWTRQMTTEYADLPEAEKESDRAEADKMLGLVSWESEPHP